MQYPSLTLKAQSHIIACHNKSLHVYMH